MTTKSNTSQNKIVQAIKSFTTSALIAASTLVFLGVGPKTCEAEQENQVKAAKAHQAVLNEVAK